MIKRVIIIVILVLLNEITSGQIYVKNPLSSHEVESLQKSLKERIPDTTRIGILLKIANHNLDKINIRAEEISDLDSAATFIRIAKELNTRQQSRKYDGLISLYEATLSRKRGNTDTAMQLVNKAIKQLQTSNDEFNLTLAYLELSCCYDANDPQQEAAIKDVFNKLFKHLPQKIDSIQQEKCMFELHTFYVLKMRRSSMSIKLDFLHHLVAALKMLNYKDDEFWTRKEIADIHYWQGKSDIAISELLEIAKEQKDGAYSRICWTYDLLSGIYGARGSYEKAIYYALESLKNINTAFDSSGLNVFYARIATYYRVTGSVAEAVQWNLTRLNYMVAIKQGGSAYTTLFHIVSDMIILGRAQEALNLILDKSKNIVPMGDVQKLSMLLSLAKCYAAVKNYAVAEKYCEESIKLDELVVKRKTAPGSHFLYQFLASFYLEVGQYDKAEKYKMFNASSDFFFKLDSARGNYLSAIRHLQAGNTKRDSIFTAAKSKQIEELKIAYESDRKDTLIRLKEDNIQLLTKQDKLQKSKLQQGAILRNISFAVAALLIIIVILFYNRYRLKQRTNVKLESQQREIANQNISLQHLVNEKEWLLKEIHHRVKNNLQIVMSLLNSQSAYIDNEPALTAIHDSQHRVHAMSLIHQKLYNTENVSAIDMSSYIRELAAYLSDSFNTGQRIRFEYNIDSLEMDVSQAIPLGLILNEAITNSIKYAFPGNRDGVINISLINTSPNHYLLSISDNGIGMPVQFKDKKPGSLGMSLMEGLSEDLDGTFSIENNNGTAIKISFVHDVSVKRPDPLVGSFVTAN